MYSLQKYAPPTNIQQYQVGEIVWDATASKLLKITGANENPPTIDLHNSDATEDDLDSDDTTTAYESILKYMDNR